jgi:hypothetical protein
MIRIHPDNGGDAESYGATVLGSPLGSTDFIRSKLDGKVEELENVDSERVTLQRNKCTNEHT